MRQKKLGQTKGRNLVFVVKWRPGDGAAVAGSHLRQRDGGNQLCRRLVAAGEQQHDTGRRQLRQRPVKPLMLTVLLLVKGGKINKGKKKEGRAKQKTGVCFS